MQTKVDIFFAIGVFADCGQIDFAIPTPHFFRSHRTGFAENFSCDQRTAIPMVILQTGFKNSVTLGAIPKRHKLSLAIPVEVPDGPGISRDRIGRKLVKAATGILYENCGVGAIVRVRRKATNLPVNAAIAIQIAGCKSMAPYIESQFNKLRTRRAGYNSSLLGRAKIIIAGTTIFAVAGSYDVVDPVSVEIANAGLAHKHVEFAVIIERLRGIREPIFAFALQIDHLPKRWSIPGFFCRSSSR